MLIIIVYNQESHREIPDSHCDEDTHKQGYTLFHTQNTFLYFFYDMRKLVDQTFLGKEYIDEPLAFFVIIKYEFLETLSATKFRFICCFHEFFFASQAEANLN